MQFLFALAGKGGGGGLYCVSFLRASGKGCCFIFCPSTKYPSLGMAFKADDGDFDCGDNKSQVMFVNLAGGGYDAGKDLLLLVTAQLFRGLGGGGGGGLERTEELGDSIGSATSNCRRCCCGNGCSGPDINSPFCNIGPLVSESWLLSFDANERSFGREETTYESSFTGGQIPSSGTIRRRRCCRCDASVGDSCGPSLFDDLGGGGGGYCDSFCSRLSVFN
mmetsp:Transcript_33246/g.80420  ORF Transcript_33246/g.80420 Transcript_33246/m.80420 type:complete len:221 (-) Transcript_33246:256-918(-)